MFFAKVLDVNTDAKKNITIAKMKIVWPEQHSNVISNTGSTVNAGSMTRIGLRTKDFSVSNNIGNNRKKNVLFTDIDSANNKNNAMGVATTTTTMSYRKELDLSQIATLAIQKNTPEKDLVYDQNQLAKERLQDQSTSVYTFRQKAAIFGHNAPSYDAVIFGNESNNDLSNWDSPQLHIYQKVVIKKINKKDVFQSYYTLSDNRHIIFLDRVYDNILSNNSSADNWIVFSAMSEIPAPPYSRVLLFASKITNIREETLVEYAVTAKATGVQLDAIDDIELYELQKFQRRNTTVFTQSQKLELASKVDESPIRGDFVELEKGVIGIKNGQTVTITGEILDTHGKPSGKTKTEYKEVREITTKKIYFDKKLDNIYVRESVKICANVARATHGETKQEILGSGDPSISQQSFMLKQKPLTYIKSPKSTGASSSLEVRVDDVLWQEIDNLYGVHPNDNVFVTRIEDDGSVFITFGDGKRGSRPFLGVENLSAKYRIGTGKEGMLKQNQLNLLIDKPLGVKSVTNPFSTCISKDPENMENAKINAPLKVLTMNRIVSISDFENFARCFAGVGKAKATEIWDGTRNVVHLSVASSDGQKLDPLTCDNITKSIQRFMDPHLPFILDSFIKKTFSLTAKIKINSDMIFDKVILSVKNAIQETFSFQKRQFGQSVTLSEVVTLIQNIQGVLFVALNELYIDEEADLLLKEEPNTTTTTTIVNNNNFPNNYAKNKLEKFLYSFNAHFDNRQKKIVPAEILIINPQGVTLLIDE